MKVTSTPFFFPWQGRLEGQEVETSQKKFKDICHIYKNPIGVDENTVMYDVYSIGEQPIEGHLLWGLSVLHPIYVDGECNMTRGHFHQNRECQEYYWCSAGQGLLLLMDEDGKCWAQEMKPGSLHKIDGNIAHRLVNTGDCDLEVVACWPATSGHDYDAIDQQPFPIRIFKKEGEITYEQL